MPKQQYSLLFALPAILFCISSHAAESDVESFESIPLPQVLTPVRLKQPRTEVPASVSVIDADMIAASGIRELPEILRLVPGMAVGARSGWDYVVSYHGTNRRNSHRMQVMIDGRSIYQASLATIDWDDIPLAMEDIERIEITRGPNTAAYGANAFLGIINIITKHPDDAPGIHTKVTMGNKSTTDLYASAAGTTGTGSYRLTLATKRDSGFDHQENGSPRRDGKDLQFVNGRWIVSPTNDWSLDFQMGYKTGAKHDDFGDTDVTPPDQIVDNYYASAVSQHFLSANNSLKFQLDYSGTKNTTEWRTCDALLNLYPDLAGTPYVPIYRLDEAFVCGDLNQNLRSERVDFDMQHTWLSNGAWKFVWGTHAQYQNVISETYYSGSAQRDTYQLFGNLEYHFLPQWSATIAGSHEYFAEGQHAFSPRLALLFFPSENHSFRAVYSEAIRTPDLFETDSKWHYIARNISLIAPVAIPLSVPNDVDLTTYDSPTNLRPERIRSREIGYYGLWWNRQFELDVKLFNDDLNDLISDGPSWGNYDPANNDNAKQRGYETEIKLHMGDKLTLHASAAIIKSSASTPTEKSLTPEKSGSLAAIYEMGKSWQMASFYYFANPINGNKFSRWDNRIAKRIRIASSDLTLSATVQHYFNSSLDLFGSNIYDGPNRIYLAADLAF